MRSVSEALNNGQQWALAEVEGRPLSHFGLLVSIGLGVGL